MVLIIEALNQVNVCTCMYTRVSAYADVHIYIYIMHASAHTCVYICVFMACVKDSPVLFCEFRFSMPICTYYQLERSGGQEFGEYVVNLSCSLNHLGTCL